MTRRTGALLIGFTMAALLMVGNTASAAIVPTVPMGTLNGFAVLGASTVTNTGNSVLNGNLGVWAGTSITGFPPGVVVLPSTTHAGDGVAQQAQTDLTAAYLNAAGRTVDNTTASAELGGLILVGGVYEAPGHIALGLTGTLTLDGANDLNSVFIFQTDAALTTAASSAVLLINGAQECNVFWQIGSSATLGASSVFRGNILAQTAITVGATVTVRGRALARDAAVTLDSDNFIAPTCAQVVPTTTTVVPTTTTTVAPTTTTTVAPTTTTAVAPTTTTAVAPTTTAASAAASASTSASGFVAFATAIAQQTTATNSTATAATTSTSASGIVGVATTTTPGAELPFTGSPVDIAFLLFTVCLTLGVVSVRLGRAPRRVKSRA